MAELLEWWGEEEKTSEWENSNKMDLRGDVCTIVHNSDSCDVYWWKVRGRFGAYFILHVMGTTNFGMEQADWGKSSFLGFSMKIRILCSKFLGADPISCFQWDTTTGLWMHSVERNDLHMNDQNYSFFFSFICSSYSGSTGESWRREGLRLL